MKTTEVFVEQVLIGAVVLVIAALMMHIPAPAFGTEGAAGFLLVAYLIGVVYDRCADTLVEDVEQHIRVRFAYPNRGKEPAGDLPDPFPETKYRIEILEHKEAAAYAAYLRSRLRLSRALFTLTPGIAVAYLQWGADRRWQVGASLTVCLSYGLAFAYQVIVRTWIHRKVPKTYEVAKCRAYIESVRWWFAGEPVVWMIAVLAAFGFALTAATTQPNALAAAVASPILASISGWAWWRIYKTYLQFLQDFFQNRNVRPAAAVYSAPST